MGWKIITDSGCDLKKGQNSIPNCAYINVPLTIHVGEKEFIDDEKIDIENMMKNMSSYDGKTSSSCPSPESYLQAFGKEQNIIVITLTGALSGSYNSAELAKKIHLEQHPHVNIQIFDSLAASGKNILLVQAVQQFIQEGLEFKEVVVKTEQYLKKTKLLFALENVDNLVKNGRLTKLAGKIVGLLNIKIIGQASQEGALEILHKTRGTKKTIQLLWDEMIHNHYQGGRVVISHCNNLEFCKKMTMLIRTYFPNADIQIYPTSGLCSYYAEQGGILMGYEIS